MNQTTPQKLADRLRVHFCDRIDNVDVLHAQTAVEVVPAHLVEVCTALCDKPDCHFEQLTDLCRVDFVAFGEDEIPPSYIATSEGFGRGFMSDDRHYTVLDADGNGRSDTRPNLRNFFEIDRRWIGHAAIAGRERRDDLARCRARKRDRKTRSGHAGSVDSVSANIQRSVLAGRACVDSILRNRTSGSDLP